MINHPIPNLITFSLIRFRIYVLDGCAAAKSPLGDLGVRCNYVEM
jgi:hypothetical protein